MSRIFLDECYQNSDPIAVLEYEYNLIVWFKVCDMVISFDLIYDNYPQYTLSVFRFDYASKRYKELLHEGWRPIIELTEKL